MSCGFNKHLSQQLINLRPMLQTPRLEEMVGHLDVLDVVLIVVVGPTMVGAVLAVEIALHVSYVAEMDTLFTSVTTGSMFISLAL